MVFSSLIFIFRFLPIGLFIYFMTPNKFKNLSLLILSLIFYSWSEPKYIFIMIISIFVDYFISRLLNKNKYNRNICKFLLILSLSFNLGILFLFKYINFFIENINFILGSSLKYVELILPLGISFYTFQTLSYTIDVYRGKVEAEKNIINFATYICLFPQLIAGPIVKYIDVNRDLVNRKIDIDKIENGIELFILGLGKKVLIANNIGMLWSEIERLGFSNISTLLAWGGIIAFALQIYFDFSGYSLMARGLGKIFGFNFPNNFYYPYTARSMTEFWKKWHITLGAWFKEYLYIPLGGNKLGKLRMFFNLFIVWTLTGFWHGASYNFILWGGYFFILIFIEKLGMINFLNRHRFISHIYVIFFLLVGWSLFAISDLGDLKVFLYKIFIYQEGISTNYYLRSYMIIFILAIVLSTPIVNNFYMKLKRIKFIYTIIILLIFLLSVAYIVDSSYNPFLYFKF